MKAPRDVFGETLVELNEAYPQLMVLCSDLGAATKTGVFEKKFPEKYLNTGICEQNMMSVAAGLASEGFTVVASTFAVFAAGRAFDQHTRGWQSVPTVQSTSVWKTLHLCVQFRI